MEDVFSPEANAADTQRKLNPEPIKPVAETVSPIAQSLDGSQSTTQYNQEASDTSEYENGVPVFSELKRKFLHGDNTAVQIGKMMYNKIVAGPVDDTWTHDAVTQWIDETNRAAMKNKEPDAMVPVDQAWRYYGTANRTEAMMRLQDARDDLHAQRVSEKVGGFGQFAASMAAGFIDIDSPLMLMTGGATKGMSTAAKTGFLASRAGTLTKGLMEGTAIGAAFGVTDYQFNPNADMEGIAMMSLMGAGFGAAHGTLFHGTHASRDAFEGIRADALNELGETAYHGAPQDRTASTARPFETAPKDIPVPEQTPSSASGEAPRRAQVFDPADLAGTGQEHLNTDRPDPLTGGGSSVGAAQQGRTHTGVGIDGITNPDSIEIYQKAKDFLKNNEAVADFEDPIEGRFRSATTEATANRALWFRKGLQKLGIESDFDQMMQSGLSTARYMALNLFESPSGIARSQTTAAILKEHYQTQLVNAFRPYAEAYKEAKRIDNLDMRVAIKEAFYVTNAVADHKKRFNEAVVAELMGRARGEQSSAPDHIRKAADAVDAFFSAEYRVGKGHEGETAMTGYDEFQSKVGHWPQRWSGHQMSRMIDEAGTKGGKQAQDKLLVGMKRTVYNAIANDHPNMDPDIAAKIADAIVTRGINSRRGFNRDLISLLHGDEAEFIKEAMKRNGVSDRDIASVIESIVGSRQERTKTSNVRHRTEVDLRAVDPSTGIRLMDMVDTDIERVVNQRMHQTAGLSALARMGLPDRVAWEKLTKAILDEQDARGERIKTSSTNLKDKAMDFVDKESRISQEQLDAYYSYFSGHRPVSDSLGEAIVNRIMKVTRLSLMNGLGLTSMADLGVIAGSVGWQRFFDHAGQELMYRIKDTQSPLSKELHGLSLYRLEQGLINDRILYDQIRADPTNPWSKFDAFLHAGLELQGHMSGFFAVQNSMRRIAISSTITKLFEGFKAGEGGFSHERLKDMGLDQKFMDMALKHAEFDDAGKLLSLNAEKNWSTMDLQQFQLAIARTTNQLVQQGMIGESNWAFHRDGLARLLLQFKSFPLLAIDKQFTRNMRFADSEALQTFFAGIIFGGAVYTAKEAVAGKADELDAKKIAYGAMNMSNMLGWVPMFTDPVLAAAGTKWNLSGFNRYGATNVIGIPPAMSVLDKLPQIPFAAARLGGQALGMNTGSQSDIRILKATPLIGNWTGAVGILNHIGNQITESNIAKKQADKQSAKAASQQLDKEQMPEQTANPIDKAITAIGE